MEINKPNAIKYSVGLLWLSAALTLLLTIAMLFKVLPFTVLPIDTVPNFITAFILGLCAYKISKGRNWAKWLLLILFVLGALIFPFIYFFAPDQITGMPGIVQVSGFVQCILQTIAIVLLFVKSSRGWFKEKAKLQGITSNNTLNKDATDVAPIS